MDRYLPHPQLGLVPLGGQAGPQAFLVLAQPPLSLDDQPLKARSLLITHLFLRQIFPASLPLIRRPGALDPFLPPRPQLNNPLLVNNLGHNTCPGDILGRKDLLRHATRGVCGDMHRKWGGDIFPLPT